MGFNILLKDYKNISLWNSFWHINCSVVRRESIHERTLPTHTHYFLIYCTKTAQIHTNRTTLRLSETMQQQDSLINNLILVQSIRIRSYTYLPRSITLISILVTIISFDKQHSFVLCVYSTKLVSHIISQRRSFSFHTDAGYAECINMPSCSRVQSLVNGHQLNVNHDVVR